MAMRQRRFWCSRSVVPPPPVTVNISLYEHNGTAHIKQRCGVVGACTILVQSWGGVMGTYSEVREWALVRSRSCIRAVTQLVWCTLVRTSGSGSLSGFQYTGCFVRCPYVGVRLPGFMTRHHEHRSQRCGVVGAQTWCRGRLTAHQNIIRSSRHRLDCMLCQCVQTRLTSSAPIHSRPTISEDAFTSLGGDVAHALAAEWSDARLVPLVCHVQLRAQLAPVPGHRDKQILPACHPSLSFLELNRIP